MEVLVYWGRTGTGKTRSVYEYSDSNNVQVYTLPQNYKGGVVWWDGYDGQEVVLIDDFYGWLPLSYLLQLLDRYPFKVRTNDGYQEFRSKRIYITSNQDPREWYSGVQSEETKAAMLRRITSIKHFAGDLLIN